MFEDLPFFALLILTILPITIAVILLIRIINLAKDVMYGIKQRDTSTIQDFGLLLIFLTIFAVIVTTVSYLLGDQPDSFSLFEYLVEDMLPVTWMVIILYGILVNLNTLVRRA